MSLRSLPVRSTYTGTHLGKGSNIGKKSHRVNEEIRAQQVRVIAEDGTQAGVMSLRDALDLAYDKDLDLIEVAPNADPPVCRILDAGKFFYERAKKEREARRSQKATEVKEIRLRPKTGEHDIAYKLKDARRFLESGAKVKVRVRFRGREVTHADLGVELLNRVAEHLSDISTIEQHPEREGRSLLMVLSPAKK